MTNTDKKRICKHEIISEIERIGPEVVVVMGAGDIGLEVKKIEEHYTNG